MLKTYEKPALRYHKMVSEKRIANTCWGWGASGGSTHQFWYDKNEKTHGYVHYYLNAGSKCGSINDILEVYWHTGRADTNPTRVYRDQVVNNDMGQPSTPYNDLYNYLISVGGAEGNPFKGYGEILDDEPKDS